MIGAEPEDVEDLLLSVEYASEGLERVLPRKKPYDIVHNNLYNAHPRLAKKYLSSTVLLAGDAAQVNNPLGGMEIKCAIHDGPKTSTDY